MMLVSWTTAALVVWVTLWAIGAKGFDAFLVTFGILLTAITLYLARPHLPGMKR